MVTSKQDALGAWTVHQSSTIIKDRWIDLRADDCTTAAGASVSPYYVLHYPDWAHVVCTDSEKRICIVSQYRHAIRRVSMELPGGMIEADEDPLEAAKRELLEETGILARGWRSCGHYSTNPATHTNHIHIFACEIESVRPKGLDATENVVHEFLSMADIRRAIDAGDFAYLLHVGALCRAVGLI
jgi:8-oxo-dGTP pyrophosphatase MutT (NUDIX family)